MSSFTTTCPGCGGPAHTCDDDGVTYCDNDGPNGCHAKAKKKNKGNAVKGAGMHCEYSHYFRPSDRR